MSLERDSTQVEPTPATNHVLKNTYTDKGDSGVVVSAGFQNVDNPVSITCPGPGGCTIEAQHWLQVGGQTNSGNLWAICTEVDGVIKTLCPYQGYAPADGTYATGSFTLPVSVTAGTHTIQEVVYTLEGATIGDYENTYHQYKP